MTDNLSKFNLFRLSSAPALAEIISNFREFPELAAPVTLYETPPPGFYALTGYKDKESVLLPAFTDIRLPAPPVYAKPSLSFLHILFHAPAADIFAFNPPLPQAKFAPAEIRLDKKQLSAVIGFLQTPPAFPTDTDFESAAKNEADLGNLHRANYFTEVLTAQNPGHAPIGFYADILINLGLFQEAYEYARNVADPEFYCCLAEIHRKTGDLDTPRRLLEKIPAGSPFSERKELELAWLSFEEGGFPAARDIFKKLSENSFLKTEGLFGLGVTLSTNALKNKNRKELSEAVNIFNAALKSPSPLSSKIFFHLGNIHFRTGNYGDAETCYRSSAGLWPAIQSKANLCLALIKTGNLREAAALINEIALTDLNSGSRLAAELPPIQGPALIKNSREIETSVREPLSPPQPSGPPAIQSSIKQNGEPNAVHRPQPSAPPEPAAAPVTEQHKTADIFKSRKAESSSASPGGQAAPPPSPAVPGGQAAPALSPAREKTAASLEAAMPKISNRTTRPPAADKPEVKQPAPDMPAAKQPARESDTETFEGAIESTLPPTIEESKKDDFLGRAFKLASALEDGFNKKVYFNADGLAEVEKKLRLTFIQARQNPQDAIEIVKDCSAFLCYVMQERLKGRLIKFLDFDPWGWPLIIAAPKRVVTYPIERVWKLLWQESLPEPGWLTKYLQYVQDELDAQNLKPQGVAAVQSKSSSHPERLTDAQTEHKRIMLLVSTLAETNNIELGRSGLVRLETVLKNNFRPDIPPTTDGWKLLRCYGHILAEIIMKDLQASWYNVDGNDGFWSMQLPWKTFIFPLGKIYRTASHRDSLTAYYDALLENKLRYSGL
ncbi:MAG: tetratricopeptide repeat protein [Elusimicrobia bacterium]|nr:tetratricopeptide repeat protein [Elusimicrobiota bacterium]